MTQTLDDDQDLIALREAQALMRAGAITEEEYIERAIALSRRCVVALMTREELEDLDRGLRFICHTSPEMRTRLGLEPFPVD